MSFDAGSGAGYGANAFDNAGYGANAFENAGHGANAFDKAGNGADVFDRMGLSSAGQSGQPLNFQELVGKLQTDMQFMHDFVADPAKVLSATSLTDAEKTAVQAGKVEDLIKLSTGGAGERGQFTYTITQTTTGTANRADYMQEMGAPKTISGRVCVTVKPVIP